MQLYKVCQRLGAAPPDPRVLDLQPVETPFKKSWVRPWHGAQVCPIHKAAMFVDCQAKNSYISNYMYLHHYIAM